MNLDPERVTNKSQAMGVSGNPAYDEPIAIKALESQQNPVVPKGTLF